MLFISTMYYTTLVQVSIRTTVLEYLYWPTKPELEPEKRASGTSPREHGQAFVTPPIELTNSFLSSRAVAAGCVPRTCGLCLRRPVEILHGGRNASGAVITAGVDVGRCAAEMASRAVQPRNVRACAAFLGGFHAMWCGGNVLARRALCQRSLGGHWCGRGMHRARRGLRGAHGCCAHRRALQRPSSRGTPPDDTWGKGHCVG